MPSFAMFKKRRAIKMNAAKRAEANAMAIKAQESLISLGYADKIQPLRLPSYFGKLAIIFSFIAAILYGISGFIYGYNLDIEKGIKFFPVLDGFSLGSLISAVASIVFSIISIVQKHTNKLTGIIAIIITLSGSLILHIFTVVAGILLP